MNFKPLYYLVQRLETRMFKRQCQSINLKQVNAKLVSYNNPPPFPICHSVYLMSSHVMNLIGAPTPRVLYIKNRGNCSFVPHQYMLFAC